jgi:cyclopropane-fatty-acyl-phospholipid synthase
MISRLFKGHVEHERFHPTAHLLRYDLYVYMLDLAELEVLDRRLPFFAYNRAGLVSLHDSDYLDAGPGSIRQKLLLRLAIDLPEADIDRIVMVTSPRLLGHVFNPVTFYLCFNRSERLMAAVAEVNNTFGEKHVYLLPSPSKSGQTLPARFTADKAFHVSPFNTMGGTYRFHFGSIQHELDIRIDLHRDGDHILRAQLNGTAQPLTPMNHLKTLLRHPFMPHLTTPRIYLEAFKLKFKRKLVYHDKPVPNSPMTIRRLPPTAVQRQFLKLLLGHLSKATKGRLQLTLPNGTRHAFGREAGAAPVRLTVNDYRFFSRVVMGADIGLGEAFMFDEWDTDDIPGVIAFFIRNRDTIKDGEFKESWLQRVPELLRFVSRANTLTGSRRNIQRHYDLSNDFFQTFLDDSMSYSSAVYKASGETLETAQRNKYRRIIAKARLGAGDHLLEIGCGWGGFAIEAVRRTGCRVTGITISEDQYRLARKRVAAAGLQDRIRILFRDYRNMRGRFDRIVSIEMLEAVGHAHFKTFFKQMDRLLAPDGIAVVQVITIPDQHYNTYRRTPDWIQKHIFPGGLLPSLTILARNMTRHSRLMIDQVENIGDHYATTLAEWHKRFKASEDRVRQLGFDRTFRRKWSYYLGCCEAGFRQRVLGDLQLVLTRQGNPNLIDARKAV